MLDFLFFFFFFPCTRLRAGQIDFVPLGGEGHVNRKNERWESEKVQFQQIEKGHGTLKALTGESNVLIKNWRKKEG